MLLERTRQLLDRLLAKKAPQSFDEGVQSTLDGRSAVALAEALICEAAGLGGPAPEDREARLLLEALTMRPAGTAQASLRQDLLDPGDGPRGALAGALGMALSGLRTTAFLNGRDLPGLSDLLSQAAGLQAPLVLHAGLSAIGGPTRALGDGHDGYHTISHTGVVQLFAKDPQQAVDFALIARRITETALVPVLVAIDDEATGQQASDLLLPTAATVQQYLGQPDDFVDSPNPAQALLFGARRRRVVRWHDLDRPLLMGAAQGAESWPLTRAARQVFVDAELPEIIRSALEAFASQTGRSYGPLFHDQTQGADLVLVCQGSLQETALSCAKQLTSRTKKKVGVLGLHMLRPWPGDEITTALGSCRAVLTLERTDNALGSSPPLSDAMRQIIQRATTGSAAWSAKNRPTLYSARFGHGAPANPADLLLHAEQVLNGEAAPDVYLGLEVTPDASAWPKRQAMQDALPTQNHVSALRAPRPGAEPGTSAVHTVPGPVRQIRQLDPTLSGLPRFWDQVGGLYAAGAQRSLGLDPFLATGTVPVLSASFKDVSPLRSQLPELQPDRCTGCGVCWSTCPEGAINVSALSPAELLEAGMQAASKAGHPTQALRPLIKRIAKAALRAAAEDPSLSTAGALFRAVFDPILEKAAADEAKYAALEVAFASSVAQIEDLPISATDLLFHDPRTKAPGAGHLLSLSIDADTCKGCGLCVAACDDQALIAEPDNEARTEQARKLKQQWLRLPDTSGALIDQMSAATLMGPLAANLMSKHAVGLVGGDEVEPGSGERQALRLVLAEAEAERQRALSHQVHQLNDLQDKLSSKIQALLSAVLPVQDLQALSEGLKGLAKHEVNLSNLSERMAGAVDGGHVDAAFLQRLTEAANSLADLRYTLQEGRQGLGRARFGLVLCEGTFAEGLTRFPYNPFTAPVVAASPRSAARMARGLFEGQLASAHAVVAAIHDAQQLLGLKDKLPFDDVPRAALPFDSWSPEARSMVPPVFVIGDEATLGEAELGSLLALLGTERPFKVVVLADPGRRLGPGGGAPPPDLGMLAIAHRQALVVQSSVAFPKHFGPAVHTALHYDGPALLHLYAPSPQRDGIAPDASLALARLAVQSRTFPLFTYDPRRAGVLGARVDLSGNPEPKAPWYEGPEGPITPAHWLIAQRRFDAHFEPADGAAPTVQAWLSAASPASAPAVGRDNGERVSPSPRLLSAIRRWAGAWQALQEIAGEVTPFTAQVEADAEARLRAEHEAQIAALNTAHAEALQTLQASQEQRTAHQVTDRLMQLAGYEGLGRSPKS